MRIIKPYGRSETVESDAPSKGRLKRVLDLTDSEGGKTRSGIPRFLSEEPEAVIAQCISTIDKIATKPKGNSKPNARQRSLRSKIGAACWEHLVQSSFSSLGEADLERLKSIWDWKIHPYGDGTDDKTNSMSSEGRWYRSFNANKEIGEIDFGKLAGKIHDHLFSSEMRIDGTRRNDKGRISSRSESAERSVLAPVKALACDSQAAWTDDDLARYRSAPNDLAAVIWSKAYERVLERDRGTSRQGARIPMSVAGDALYRHYGEVFKDDHGNIVPARSAKTDMPGLFAIHMAVKDSYRRILKQSKKRNHLDVLPKDMDALFRLIRFQSANRDVNDLIRLGRIVHYESNPSEEDRVGVGPGSPVWTKDLSESAYWTSEGQTQIKRSEAFIRIWRNAMSQGLRTLKAWADPDNAIAGDITFGNNPEIARADNFDIAVNRAKLDVLFGSQASMFGEEYADEPGQFLFDMIKGMVKLRGRTFHFNGRTDFAKTVSQRLADMGTEATRNATRSLWEDDQHEAFDRLKQTLVGVQVGRFANEEQSVELVRLLSDPSSADIPLPKFNRMLDRMKNTRQSLIKKGQQGPVLSLPDPGRMRSLENPALLCKYTCCKLLYERPFRDWLNSLGHVRINKLIDAAVRRGTDEARKINRSSPRELVVSKASKLPKLEPSQRISEFFDGLTAATATEMRVQRGYESDGEAAREQAGYIEDLKCDVVGRAFREFLGSHDLEWLLSLRENSSPRGATTELSAIESKRRAATPEQWQANLYCLFHLMPVDDVSKLLHQFRKWSILTGREHSHAKPDARKSEILLREEAKDKELIDRLRDAMLLYLEMHDAKFDGAAIDIGLDPFKALFEQEDDFGALFLDPNASDAVLAGTRRGLREIIRFNHMPNLQPIFAKNPISHDSVEALRAIEAPRPDAEDGELPSEIDSAHRTRERLHDKWARPKKRQKFTQQDKKDYIAALDIVRRHRELAAQVRLTNHVRLHRLMMAVMARLVDYAGIWERDLYFMTLGLMKHEGLTPTSAFPHESARTALKKDGKVLTGCDKDGQPYMDPDFKNKLLRFHDPRKAGIRNALAHFAMLAGQGGDIDLTKAVNQTRSLMAYDRKLKNAVSKSVAELLKREGLIVRWTVDQGTHDLVLSGVTSDMIKHLGGKTTERKHGDDFVSMVADLFQT